MKRRIAVYAASFDPITFGHINVAERTAPLYDELILLVAVDRKKTYTFSSEERKELVEAATAHIPNVSVRICINRYVITYAEELGAQTIIRGLRNFQDLEYEQTLAKENRNICPHIETLFIPCLPELMHVSSSMVKGHVGVDPTWERQVARSVPKVVFAKLKAKYIFDKARKYWNLLMNVLGNPLGSEEIFQDLLKRHSEPQRYYHILEHILAMLDALEEFFGGASQYPSVAFAIWFHDAVYDPKAKDNEMQSLHLAVQALEIMNLLYLESGVSSYITASQHLTPPTEKDAQTTKIMVDLDLLILGASPEEFSRYEENIQKEYAWVPKDIRAKKRTEILQSFLARPYIYSTPAIRDRFEVSARKNLERSILKMNDVNV